MTPIMHGSREWLDMLANIQELTNELNSVRGLVETLRAELNVRLAALESQQGTHHHDNQSQIKDLKREVDKLDALINGTETTQGIRTDLALMVQAATAAKESMEAAAKEAKKHARRMVGTVATGLGLILALIGALGSVGLVNFQDFKAHHTIIQELPQPDGKGHHHGQE